MKVATEVFLATVVFLVVTVAWKMAQGQASGLDAVLSAVVFAMSYGALRVALILFSDRDGGQ